MTWIFGDFHLDRERFELRRGTDPVRLEPQVLALLVYLVRYRDRMVTKDDIATEVWPGRIASDASISSCIRSARLAVGDDGHQQTTIRTVHGKGFRFVAEVKETAPATVATGLPAAEPKNVLTGRPSIAILPFRPLAMAPDAGWQSLRAGLPSGSASLTRMWALSQPRSAPVMCCPGSSKPMGAGLLSRWNFQTQAGVR
jgi:DNA-binding winged helix-turn-helix (wHTH) protein